MKKLWDVYAYIYDSLRFFLPYKKLQNRSLKKLRIMPNLKILDAGCGTGNLLKLILSKYRDVFNINIFGVDSSKQMLDRARKKMHLEYNTKLFNLDMKDVLNDFGELFFDRIVSINSLYAVKDPKKLIDIWFKALDHGGILVLANPFKMTQSTIIYEHFKAMFLKKNIDKLPESCVSLLSLFGLFLINKVIASLAKKGLYNFMNPVELEEMLIDVGFKILDKEILYGGTVVLFSAQKNTGVLHNKTGAILRRAHLPEEIDAFARLRYEAYCREMGSLDNLDYPDKKETDRFDDCSIYFIGKLKDDIIGGVRLIPDTDKGFLLEEHFTLPPNFERNRKISVEYSRLVISKIGRKTNLWSAIVDYAMKWSKKRGIGYWLAVCQDSLWAKIAQAGWGTNIWSDFVEYHNTRSAPGNLFSIK